MPYPRRTAHNSLRRTPSPTPLPPRALTAAPLSIFDFPLPSANNADNEGASSIDQNTISDTSLENFSDVYNVNMKCSRRRYNSLRDHLLRVSDNYNKADSQSEAQRPPAIICVQDPPPHIAYHKMPGYRCEYHIREHLKPADYPLLYNLSGVRTANERAVSRLSEESTALSFKRLAELMGLRQVAFFIRNDIPKRDTRVVPHHGCNEPYAATLEVDTQSGTLCIHNMYNHDQSINIAELKDRCMQSDNDILVGDSNLHHKLWGGSTVSTAASASSLSSQLALALQETRMQTCMLPGTITYAPGLRTVSARQTSIDIVFSSMLLRPRIHDCGPIEVRGYESDHAVIRMSMDMEPSSAPPRTKKLYEEIDHAFKQDLVTQIKSFVRCPGDSILEYGAHVVRCIAGADERVPTKRTIERTKPPIPKLFAQKLEIERRALLALERKPTSENVTLFEQAKGDLDKDIAAENRKSFRKTVARTSEKLRWRHYTWARRAQTWDKPQQAPTIPVLQVDGKTFTTIEEKASLYARTIWPEVRNHTDGDPSSPILPNFHDREQLSCNQFVTEKEVLDTIQDLSDRKAPGSDQISNELLKACSKELAPILADLFTDMFKQCVHLKDFKHAITTLLLKPGKHPALPKSYRPVALLSCLGKVFEKLIANRFRYLAETHNLLPTLQFGAPGRDTTKALQAIIGPVYTGWCTKRKTTILSLDITGAFDRVNRAKLLQILVDKGIPNWLVRLTASFLSERSTTLNMLGTLSEPFWVDIGIPQGSPLPPILFLFSAGDIHSLFGKHDHIGADAKVHCFAYVDDT
ncbi:unnamed protein product [Alternaria burnsii]|nr:unnamed protein product [Alternaria burnsii]